MGKIENPKTRESMASKVEETAEKRAAYTRDFVAKHYTQKEFLDILAKFDIKEVDFNDDKSLVLAVHNLQIQVELPQNLSFRGCDGKFGAITMNAVSQELEQSHSRSKRFQIAEDINLPKKSDLEIKRLKKQSKQRKLKLEDRLREWQSATSMSLHINYPNNEKLAERAPQYYVFFHGDGGSISHTQRYFKTKERIDNLRRKGVNAILIIPGHKPRKTTTWNQFQRNNKLIKKMFYVATGTHATPKNIHVFSFSAGYRAVSAMLKANISPKTISMLDATYYHKRELVELVDFVRNGGKLNIVTSVRNKKTNKGLKFLKNNLSIDKGKGEFNYDEKKLGHSSSAKKYFPIYLKTTIAKHYKKDIAQPETQQTLSQYLINESKKIWANPKQYSKIMRYAKKGKCEHFCGALSRHLYEKFKGEKKRGYIWNSPIATRSTMALRGKAIRDFTANDFTMCNPGEVFFVNNPRKYRGRNKIISGTTNKIKKIADKRHWFVFLGFDSSNRPKFADNWGPSHSLTSLKRRYSNHNRVVLNVHDPHREARQDIAASIGSDLESYRTV